MYVTTAEIAKQCNGILKDDEDKRCVRIDTVIGAEPTDDDENVCVFFVAGDMLMSFDILGTTLNEVSNVLTRINKALTQEAYS